MNAPSDDAAERAAYAKYEKQRDVLATDLAHLMGIHSRTMHRDELSLALLHYAVQAAFSFGKTPAMLHGMIDVIAKHQPKN